MKNERVIVYPNKVERIIQTILDARNNKEFIFADEITPPESEYVKKLINYGEVINNPDFAPNALFLTTIFIRGGKTEQFFEGIEKRDNLKEYAWIFDPDTGLKKDEKTIELAITEFFRPQGYALDAIKKWKHNLEVINRHNGSIINYLNQEKFEADAHIIVKSLYVRNRAKTAEKVKVDAFLGYGQKLAHLAVQFLHQYGFYNFRNADSFGLPIDFQMARVMIENGGFETIGDANVNEIVFGKLLPTIIDLGAKNSWHLGEISESMWLFGNHACNKRRHSDCPLYDSCKGLVTATKYQRYGTMSTSDLIEFKKR